MKGLLRTGIYDFGWSWGSSKALLVENYSHYAESDCILRHRSDAILEDAPFSTSLCHVNMHCKESINLSDLDGSAPQMDTPAQHS